MDCSTIAELVSELNKKIERGMNASQAEMGERAKALAPPYVYTGGGLYRTGQTVDSIYSRMAGASTVEIRHNEGMIRAGGYGEHRSVINGSPFDGGFFLSALHDYGRYPLMNFSVAYPTEHMDKIANGHREVFVEIARKNIE